MRSGAYARLTYKVNIMDSLSRRLAKSGVIKRTEDTEVTGRTWTEGRIVCNWWHRDPRKEKGGRRWSAFGVAPSMLNTECVLSALMWLNCHVSFYFVITPPSTPKQRKMGLREFLRLPKKRHRKQSKAKSEVDPIEGPSEADLAVPRLTESTPDLHIDASTSLNSGPMTSHDQESNSMELISSRANLLTYFRMKQATLQHPTDFNLI
jgi:hypothetical protein